MKYLLAYVIWNKVNMLDWIADGIVESFNPDEADLHFILDNSTDGSLEKIKELTDSKLQAFTSIYTGYLKETYKFTCQNQAMKWCVALNYRAVICPQDDQKIIDKNLIKNIDNLFNIYGEKLGVIGLRDGFEFGYNDMISSGWSESIISKLPRLKNGEHAERTIVNDGGLIYPNHLIKAIGYHDTETYKRFFIEDDYCMKVKQAGFTNVVLGNSLIHDKQLASFESTNTSDLAEKDLAAFKKKWNLN